MSAIRLAAIAASCLLVASAATAAEERPARWRLASVPLDLPLDGGLDDPPSANAPGIEASTVLAELEDAYGKPDLELDSPMGKAKQQILIFVDRTIPQERLESVRARLPDAQDVASKDVAGFWQADLRGWARLLGPDFRGAAVVLTMEDGKVRNLQATLIDLARARTVFQLLEVK